MPSTTRAESRDTDDATLLLEGLRALVRTQQLSERANVSCCGMTLAQAATLSVLSLEGQMRLGALSARLGITASTLSRNVERIEERGWVERVYSPDDGRTCCLRLTAGGRRQARQIEAQNRRRAGLVLDALPAARRRRAIDGLIDLIGALDQVVGPQFPEQYRPIHEFLAARTRPEQE